VGGGSRRVYFEKIRVFKAGRFCALNTLAWDNGIGPGRASAGSPARGRVMMNGDSWGCSYFMVRGEILGFMKDKLM